MERDESLPPFNSPPLPSPAGETEEDEWTRSNAHADSGLVFSVDPIRCRRVAV